MRRFSQLGRSSVAALALATSVLVTAPVQAEILYGIGRQDGQNIIRTIDTATGRISAAIPMVGLYPTRDPEDGLLPFPDFLGYHGFAPGPGGTILGIAPYSAFGFSGSNALVQITTAGVATVVRPEILGLYPTRDPADGLLPFGDFLDYWDIAAGPNGTILGVAPYSAFGFSGDNALVQITTAGVATVIEPEILGLYPTRDPADGLLPFGDFLDYRGLAPGPNGTLLGVAPYSAFGFNGANALVEITPAGVATVIRPEMFALYPTNDPDVPIPAQDYLPYYGLHRQRGEGSMASPPSPARTCSTSSARRAFRNRRSCPS